MDIIYQASLCFSTLITGLFQLLVFGSQAKTKPHIMSSLQLVIETPASFLSNSNWERGMVSIEQSFPRQPCIITAFSTEFSST